MSDLTVEIFAVGTWNGMPFDIEDLNSIANAFHSLSKNHQVPLKMGHNEEQPFTDGQPALGWVTDVFVEGKKLLAKFSDVPEIVQDAFKAKLYKNVSIELDFGVEYKDSFYPLVLSGVALLGADIPAVNTLADLQAFMSKDDLKYKKRAAFSAVSGKKRKVKVMSDDKDEEVIQLKRKITGLENELAKLTTETIQLKKDSITNKAEFKAMQGLEADRVEKEQRGLLVTQLESMVKSKKIAPFTRDDFLADYDEADDSNKKHVVYTVEKMEKTIDANPTYFGAEQARIKADNVANEDGKDAGAIVVERAHKYMADHGEKNFSVAKTAILRADSELATRYTRMEA